MEAVDKTPSKKKSRPIVSFGIICFAIDSDGSPKYLIYQRRDNYEYVDIIRGNWNNEYRLQELFNALSLKEKERIKYYSFKELWDDLWVIHGSYIHTEGYEKAKKKFDTISSKLDIFLSDQEDEIQDKRSTEPQWGFPKGKKNVIGKVLDFSKQFPPRETDQECALREFAEETKLSTESMIFWGVPPKIYTEFYKGNNNKPYCTNYFLAEVPVMEIVKRIPTPGCIRKDAVSEEAEDARWMSFDEACLHLAPRRQTILKKVNHLIETSYHIYSPFYDVKSDTKGKSVKDKQ